MRDLHPEKSARDEIPERIPDIECEPGEDDARGHALPSSCGGDKGPASREEAEYGHADNPLENDPVGGDIAGGLDPLCRWKPTG